VETDLRSKLTARLAERGLAFKSFEDTVLTLSYNPAADSAAEAGNAVAGEELSQYGRGVLLSLPGAESIFPRLGEVRIDRSRSGPV
jgi:hypothetical protein